MKPPTREKLQELLSFAGENNLVELAWEEGETKIAFRRRPHHAPKASAVASDAPAASESDKSPDVVVTSPLVGTFHRSVSKDRPPLVMEGNHVKPGDRLGVVECMKIPTDVVSVSGGKITQIFVNDGDPVEYGQPLFSILPADAEDDPEN